MKKITAIFLSLIMIMGAATVVAAPDISSTANYLINTVTDPVVSSVGGEWTVIGLARSGMDISDPYFENYYAGVQNYVRAKGGVLHGRKYTEYSRVILALTAIGKDPRNVSGYNLVTPILDYDKTVWQGINGPVWAIIALDCGGYGTEEIRDRYIATILESEKPGGGWSMSDSEQNADADITAMVLTAFSKYRDRPEVNRAVDRGIALLSAMQNESGGFYSYNAQASESAAQVLTALSALGIAYTDERFIKNGNTLIDNIYSFARGDGSFSHTDEGDIMATEQCFYALVAAKRLEQNMTPLFDMSDVCISENPVHRQADVNVNIPGIKYENKTFSDITGHKNQTAIEELAGRGIINGMDENIFAPDNTMTRAEFAAITVKALGLPVKEGAVFGDVKADDWFAGYVNTAFEYGIVNGVSRTEFNPYGTITLEEASVMVCRAAQLCGVENRQNAESARDILAEFTDYTSVSDWAKCGVAFCFEQGILDDSEMEIMPHMAVKRCRVADMLYNLLKGAMLI